jgi:hypothetical protein
MTDAPAQASFAFRRSLFGLAWIMLAVGLLMPGPAGSFGAETVGGSAPFRKLKAVLGV